MKLKTVIPTSKAWLRAMLLMSLLFTWLGSLKASVIAVEVGNSVNQYTALSARSSADLALEVSLQDDDGSPLSSDQLPLRVSFSSFAERDFHFVTTFLGSELQADGQPGPHLQMVPEPLNARLLAFGLVILGLLYGRRSKRP